MRSGCFFLNSKQNFKVLECKQKVKENKSINHLESAKIFKLLWNFLVSWIFLNVKCIHPIGPWVGFLHASCRSLRILPSTAAIYLSFISVSTSQLHLLDFQPPAPRTHLFNLKVFISSKYSAFAFQEFHNLFSDCQIKPNLS